jgi:hypothetical protein
MTYNEAVSILTELYYSQLGRAPDSAGLDWWARALANGQTTTENVAAEFAKTPEAAHYTMSLDSLLEDIYWSELGRAVDADGLGYYKDFLRRRVRSEESIRSEVHDSQEGMNYRASLPQIQQPDPRLSAMRSFNAESNAIVDYRRGDTLRGLALQAYQSSELWWVIAQTNNVMSDRELFNLNSLKIPDLRRTSDSGNAVQVGDNGQARIFLNRITGDQWPEYYVPMASTLDPVEFEENPDWLRGLAFVNGNEITPFPSYQYARARPNPSMPPEFWESAKNSAAIPLDAAELPLDIDKSMLEQLPLFNAGDTGPYPPPPVDVNFTPGANPISAEKELEKYPSQIQQAVAIQQVIVVAVKKTIVELFPQLHNKRIPGWGDKTWDVSPGIFDPNERVVSVATDPDAFKSGSKSVFDHEFGHAYDWAMGGISLTPGFEAAFKADFGPLVEAGRYFSERDGDSSALDPKYTRAQQETYAESFANYYSGKASWFSDKPALLKYFRALPRPVQPGQH